LRIEVNHTLNAILEKLGLYDLIAVLLPGIIICVLCSVTTQFVYGTLLNTDPGIWAPIADLESWMPAAFFAVSYFIGLILQETGSWLRGGMRKSNWLLRKALKTSDNSNMLLTETELNGVYDYVMEKLRLKSRNDNIVYNYCKYHLIHHGSTMARCDRDQSTSAMSRSLFLYFMIETVILFWQSITYSSCIVFALALVSTVLAAILFARFIRFAKLRIISIFRDFYYSEVVKSL